MVLMEEDSPDVTDSVLQQPLLESWTSINLLNGQQEAEADGTDGGGVSPEAERWEQIIWPPRPISCASPRLSFATVQWDVPDAAAETPGAVTDERGDEADLDDAPPPTRRPRGDPAEPGEREERAQRGGADSQPLDSELRWTGNYAEPCDAAEPAIQEREESTLELLESDGEIRSGTESEDDEEPADQTEGLIDDLEESRDSESEDDGLADVKAEEEREESHTLLTEQLGSEEEEEEEDDEEEAASADTDQTEEQDEELQGEDEQTPASCCEESLEEKTVDCVTDVVSTPAEPLQIDDVRLTLTPDPPSDLLRSQLQEEDRSSDSDDELTRPIDTTEMCLGQTVDPEQPKAVEGSGGASIQEAENGEKVEGSHQIVPEVEGLAEVDRSSASPQSESSQAETTQNPEPVSAEPPQDGGGESPQLQDSADQSAPPEPAEMDPPEQNQPPQTAPEQPCPEAEVTPQTGEPSRLEQDHQAPEQVQDPQSTREGDAPAVLANGASPHLSSGQVDREKARQLAQRLFQLDGVQRADVVKHLDKDNDFSRAVGEEYLRFFDFSGQNLDEALRSFLKVVVLIGESQERERVLQHFSCRFQQSNPALFPSSGAVLALTCALMLLNTDLHGQHVGKSMSSSKFVSNLDGMNEGANFSKDLLKSLYNSIKSEPLPWAVDGEELKSAVLPEEDAGEDAPLRSKANPFQDVPHDKTAAVVKQGFLQRKLHADIDGKRTPWGKRGWKTFFGVLKGMVLYLLKDDYRGQTQTQEEVVGVHHSLAEPAADYTKKPFVFRLQTADWRVFLFQASSKAEMTSWIGRINLISALHSSPPFPAAVGSQRRFCRPILPASQSAHTLDRQLQAHSRMLDSFREDLSELQRNAAESRKARARELEERRVRAEYLHFEVCRYEIYLQVLEAWGGVQQTGGGGVPSGAALKQFDRALCSDPPEDEDEEQEEAGLKRSHSSPSLEADAAPPQLVKVRRNISERRTYRRMVVPRWNKEV